MEITNGKMRPRIVTAREAEAARALHRLAFALWRAAFYLQRGPTNNPRAKKEQKNPMVCNCVFLEKYY